jgi:predicted MFS family arabinose efflux permease
MDAASEPQTLTASAKRAIAFLAVASFASSANIRIADPLIPALTAEFGVTAGQASQIVTGFAIAYGIFQFVHGPLGDRFGKARLVALACAAAALLAMLSALAHSLHALIAARLAVGAVAAAIIPLSLAFIGDAAPYHLRQTTLARLLTGITLGMIFGQTFGGLIAETLGWRAAFGAVALCLAAASIGLAFEIRQGGAAAERGSGTGSILQSYVKAFALTRDPWVRTILLIVMIEGLLLLGAFTFMSAHLHEHFGLTYGQIGLLTGLYGLGGLVYSFAAPVLVRQLGEKGLATGGGLTLALGFGTMALAPAWWVAPGAVFAIGLGFMMLHNTLQTRATQMAPQARGSGVALFAACFFVGTTMGVPIFAFIYDKAGGAPVFAVAALLLPILAFVFRTALGRKGTA